MDESFPRDDWDLNENALFRALADDTTRTILSRTSDQPRSANELADHVDVSLSTIYRRLEQLEGDGLIDERLRVDMSGDHHKMYQATITHVGVDIDGDGVRTHVEPNEDVAERFARIWERIRGDR
ncbi:ArsR/SmtB family transcription factor [Haloarchaeobius amylolyticus]|uniref:ArsR/SmtB family transcription factor n=1 Tax=Haloarchaeobius amylolyticus TaxID=1198296 RepID=UPI00226ED9BB